MIIIVEECAENILACAENILACAFMSIIAIISCHHHVGTSVMTRAPFVSSHWSSLLVGFGPGLLLDRAPETRFALNYIWTGLNKLKIVAVVV